MKNNSKDYLAKCVMYDMLVELDRICTKNKIQYFLVGGTLLGAIRHKGFIPWDDDIDVGMLRDDYEKFVECCKKDLDGEYWLANAETEEDNPNLYYKMKTHGTEYIEAISRKSNSSKEIFIDIFPYDASPNNCKVAKFHYDLIHFYRRLLSFKCKYDFSHNRNIIKRFLNYCLRIFSVFFSKKFLIKKIHHLMTKYNTHNTNYIVNTSSSYSCEKVRMKKEVFNEYTRVQFESGLFMAMKDYDGYLKKLYGDYMKLPPKSKRTSKHSVSKIEINDYKIKKIVSER